MKKFLAASFFYLLSASAVFAQDRPALPQNIELPNPLGPTKTPEALITSITKYLANDIGPVVAALMIVVGALFILFAGGSEDRFKTGKNIILYTAIGYGIILIAFGIASIIEKLLGGS